MSRSVSMLMILQVGIVLAAAVSILLKYRELKRDALQVEVPLTPAAVSKATALGLLPTVVPMTSILIFVSLAYGVLGGALAMFVAMFVGDLFRWITSKVVRLHEPTRLLTDLARVRADGETALRRRKDQEELASQRAFSEKIARRGATG